MAKRRRPSTQAKQNPMWPRITIGLGLLAIGIIGVLLLITNSNRDETVAASESLPTSELPPIATTQPDLKPATPTSTPLASPAPASSTATLIISTPPPNEETTLPQFYTYKIVNTYPHDGDAFTQGLIYEDGIFYEGTGLRGGSTLRKVEIESGKVTQRISLPKEFFGEGITIFGDRIIQLTWQSRVGFVYDKDSFELLQEFSYPTEGWGITHDGQHLIMSDGTANLYFWDPETFEEVRRLEVHDRGEPVSLLNELEYINGEVYANIWRTTRIARISPETGEVLGWIQLDGLLQPEDLLEPVDVLNGIAYDADGDRLFVTGKWWPKLFEIEVIPLEE